MDTGAEEIKEKGRSQKRNDVVQVKQTLGKSVVISYCRDLSASTSHSIASSSPVPFTADVLKICHFLSLKRSIQNQGRKIGGYLSAAKPNSFATSVGDIAPSISCLFAKTNKIAKGKLFEFYVFGKIQNFKWCIPNMA